MYPHLVSSCYVMPESSLLALLPRAGVCLKYVSAGEKERRGEGGPMGGRERLS